MTYDHWKTTNPADAELGCVKQGRPAHQIVTTQHYSDIWTAVEDGWDLGEPTGYGKTEQGAISDLNEQLDDRDGANQLQEQQRYETEMGGGS